MNSMADFYGTARTNYVRFKDVEAVRKLLEPTQLELVQHSVHPDYYRIHTNSFFGTFDTTWFDDQEEDHELCIESEVAPLLCEDEVLIVIEVGAEKLRYLSGKADAYTWDGRHVGLCLNDIYEQAAKSFGVAPSAIACATYNDLSEDMEALLKPTTDE